MAKEMKIECALKKCAAMQMLQTMVSVAFMIWRRPIHLLVSTDNYVVVRSCSKKQSTVDVKGTA